MANEPIEQFNFCAAADTFFEQACPDPAAYKYKPPTRDEARVQYELLCDNIQAISAAAQEFEQLVHGIDFFISLLQTSPEPEGFFSRGVVGVLSPMRDTLETSITRIKATIDE